MLNPPAGTKAYRINVKGKPYKAFIMLPLTGGKYICVYDSIHKDEYVHGYIRKKSDIEEIVEWCGYNEVDPKELLHLWGEYYI